MNRIFNFTGKRKAMRYFPERGAHTVTEIVTCHLNFQKMTAGAVVEFNSDTFTLLLHSHMNYSACNTAIKGFCKEHSLTLKAADVHVAINYAVKLLKMSKQAEVLAELAELPEHKEVLADLATNAADALEAELTRIGRFNAVA